MSKLYDDTMQGLEEAVKISRGEIPLKEKVDMSAPTAPATGHDLWGWEVVKEATCTVPGKEYQTCLHCGHKDYREIPALDHDYEEVNDENGTKYVCRRCGDIKAD